MADDLTEMMSIDIDELHLVGTPAAKVAPLLAKAAGISDAKRRDYAREGVAMSTGSFPIPDKRHLRAAILDLSGYTGDKAKAKAHIIDRARALNLLRLLPKSWGVVKKGSSTMSSKSNLAKAASGALARLIKAFGTDAQAADLAGDHAKARSLRQRRALAKMSLAEDWRQKDPAMRRRSELGLGVPLLTNSHELPPDRDLGGV